MVIIVTVEFFRVAGVESVFTGLRLRVYSRILGNRLQSPPWVGKGTGGRRGHSRAAPEPYAH